MNVIRVVVPRTHHFPMLTSASVFVRTRKHLGRPLIPPVAAITRQDYRWSRCDIKSIGLMANEMLWQKAPDAIQIREGRVTVGGREELLRNCRRH